MKIPDEALLSLFADDCKAFESELCKALLSAPFRRCFGLVHFFLILLSNCTAATYLHLPW